MTNTNTAANDTTTARVYLSTVERAALIRAALKAKGWSSRMVSVKADCYSMGSTLRIRVKAAHIPLSVVKAIAEAHEDISYCEFSGEILSGGNRFVDVERDSEQFRAYADALAEQLPSGEKGCRISRARVLGFEVWSDDRNTVCAWSADGETHLKAYGASSMARAILEAYIEKLNAPAAE